MASRPLPKGNIRKLIEIEGETWSALQGLMRDAMMDLQELTEEALTDLLKKHGRPVTLRDALRASTRAIGANDSRAETARSHPGKRRRPAGRTESNR